MYKSKTQIQTEILSWFTNQSLTQEEIANKITITQGQLSKILHGDFTRVNSKTIIKICNYSNINLISDKEVTPEKSELLMSALKQVWDGEGKSEKKLASLILKFKDLI